MAGSVFGLGALLDVDYTTVCFIGIIFFTIMFELLDERMYEALEGSVYLEMMQKVYKELTILGFISFGVFMAINTNAVAHGKALLAFEFAHIVVFFSAMFFILQSILMMLLSKSIKKRIDNICAQSIPELLNKYHSTGMREYTSKFHTKMYKFIDLRNEMEVKILQHFFEEQYALEGFDFAAYLHSCYDSSFLELCEVEVSSWLFFIFLLLLNLLRYHLVLAIKGDDNSEDSYPDAYANATSSRMMVRMLGGGGGGDEDNGLDIATVISFGCIGWVLLLIAVLLRRAVRTAEMKLLMVAGCDTTFTYEDKLEMIQEKLTKEEMKLLKEGGGNDREAVVRRKNLEAEKRMRMRERSFRMKDDEEFESEGSIRMTDSPGHELSSYLDHSKEDAGHNILSQVSSITGGVTKRLSMTVDKVMHAKSAPIIPETAAALPAKSPSNNRRVSLAADDFFKGMGQKDVLAELELRQQLTLSAVLESGADHGSGDESDSSSSSSGSSRRSGSSTGSKGEKKDKKKDKKGEDDMKVENVEDERASPATVPKDDPRPIRATTTGITGIMDITDITDITRIMAVMADITDTAGITDTTRITAHTAITDSGGDKKEESARIKHSDTFKTKSSKLEEMTKQKSAIDLKLIYPFKSRTLLKQILDIVLLCNCLYLAMVVSNFGLVEVKDGWEFFGGNSTLGHIVIDVFMVLPSLLLMPVIYRVVQTNNILKAIAELDVDTVSFVVEETEEMAILEEEVVTVIRNRLKEMQAKKTLLAKVFKSIDKTGGGKLNVKELKEAMMKMGVHLTMSKFRRLFRLMDSTRSGGISYPDFHNLIFPEDEIREKAQANALAMKNHATKKKQYLHKEQNLYEDTFEGQFHQFLKANDDHDQERHREQRTLGAQTQAREQTQRIQRIKSGQLGKLQEDKSIQNKRKKSVGLLTR
ncbi:hypothetical protein TrRE_jg13455 [Triparma retinervis]|uniref:EF-hand domain-containing protein n=1 Tax=Triparma retinervis TaxID=2557542 RepID=A0A9W7APZ7_9STRA|nr:hypothetical protein TrRE_jg13455 [Triparma retinervis]